MAQAVTREPRLSEVLGGLRMIVAQLRLYPKTSPQVAKVGSTAFPPILAFLEVRRTLTIAAAPEGLLVNATRFTADDAANVALESAVVGLLRESGLKSFSLQAGATAEELIAFFHALAHKFWELRDGKKINFRLREENVTHAAVDEVEYVELSKDDLLLKDAAPKLEAAGFDTAELLRTIDERLEVAIEHGKGHEARAGIIKKALEQDPTLLGQIMRDGVTTARPGDAPGMMSADMAIDAARRIWKAMATANPDMRQVLRSVAQNILEPFHGAAAAYIVQVLSAEAPELIPDSMKDPADVTPEPSCVARAREILALSPEARAEALLREGRTIIQELTAAGRNDLVERLLGIVEERMESSKGRHRTQAADTIRSWKDVIGSEPLAKACESLRKRLGPALDHEQEAPVYAKLVELAGILLDSRMQKHGNGGSGELLDILKRHCAASDPAFPDRSGLARGVYSKFQAPPPMAHGPMSASTAERVAAALQASSIQFLIAQMKDMENVAERLELAETVSRMGPNAATLMSDELKKTKVPSETIRLLEVLPWVAGPEMAQQTLTTLLSHPVVMVRRRAALALVERKYPGTEMILLSTFDGKEPGARLAVIEAMGKLGNEAAVAKLRLVAESREESDDVRAACCAALGHAADPKSISLLLTLAAPPARGLTRIFRSVNPAVRAAATKALGAASGTGMKEVRTLLENLSTDPDALVSAAAKEALKPPSARSKVGTTSSTPAEVEPSQEIQGFSGLITEIGLDQICQVIGTSRKTGVLLVNFEGPTAKVYFDKGVIVRADFEGRSDQEAFNAFFALKEGAFVFKPGERTLEPRIKSTVDQVLMAAFQASSPSTAA